MDTTIYNHGSVNSYLKGLIFSIVLTVIPFFLVMHPFFSKQTTLSIVLVSGIIQVIIHLIYFLHLDRSPGQRNNIVALAFSCVIILLLVGLSLWIMFNIHDIMMAK